MVSIMQRGSPGAARLWFGIIAIIIKYPGIISNITSSPCFASYKLSINLFTTNTNLLSLIKIKGNSRSTVIDASEVASCGDITSVMVVLAVPVTSAH